MSHSVTVVCLPPATDEEKEVSIEDRLAKVLEPFDENNRDEKYKEYESGTADNHWSVEELREKGKLRGGTLTWHEVAAACQAEYYQNDPEEGLQVEEDGLSAFTWSTYPRDVPSEDGTGIIKGARWDWWKIGGRWTGYFTCTPSALGSKKLIYGSPGLMTEMNSDPYRCDGGPRKLLDFEAQRDRAAADALVEYDQFHAIAREFPDSKPWSYFFNLTRQEGLDIDAARKLYREQPLIGALRERNLHYGLECPLDTFSASREEHERMARLEAVPGYALLTLDGVWREPGKMGWFGMSSETKDEMIAFKKMANEYLENLPGKAVIVAVDVHI
jgi:hypothetical protein